MTRFARMRIHVADHPLIAHRLRRRHVGGHADERGAHLAQLRLHARCVRGAHAQQDLLPGRELLELGIRVLPEHAGSHERELRADVGRREQVVEHVDEAVVEVAVLVAELAIRLLEQRVVTHVHGDERLRVRQTEARLHFAHHLDDGDLLVGRNRGEDHVEGGLRFSSRSCRAATGGWSCCHCDRSRGGDAPLVFELLHEVGDFHHRQPAQLFYDSCNVSHVTFHSSRRQPRPRLF